MKHILKNIKQEKGAVATLVLFTILMFVITLMGVYVTITTMQKSQLKSDMRIKDIYGKDVERVSSIYDEIEKTLNYELTYDYTGDEQIFEVPYTGKYKIECWGAQGGDIDEFKGGRGAYTKGEILLQKGTKLYIYVGGQGTNTDVGGYNGGGSLTQGESNFGSSGGGATDIRLVNGEWNNSEGLKSRIMVAAGGGGANNRNRTDTTYMYGAGNGGAGGEIEGESGTAINYLASNGIPTYNQHYIGTGGTQTEGGKKNYYDSDNILKETITTGSFGNANYYSTQSGGGSGYYGGGAGVHAGAGGGSSFISGHNGCNAINSEGTHTGQSKHFSNYAFTNTQMISGSKQMPNPENNGTMIGKSGNGFVKIKLIIENTPYKTPYIPNGFKYKEGTWNDGYTIIGVKENTNDEFVWVPCVLDQSKVKEGDTVVTYQRVNSGKYNELNLTNITDDSSTSEIKESIGKYGGFYIAKYEAGINGNNDNNSLQTKTATDGSVKPLSQEGKGLWNYITREEAIKVSKAMINTATTGVKSSLISGEAWDTTLQWMIKASDNRNNEPNKGYDEDSTGKGWYSTPNKFHTTGYYAVNNIYDMAGNVWEWTTENCTLNNQNYFVIRGGRFDDPGSVRPAASRWNTGEMRGFNVCFRTLIYK